MPSNQRTSQLSRFGKKKLGNSSKTLKLMVIIMISFAEALMKFGPFCLTLVVISFFSFFSYNNFVLLPTYPFT